MLTCFQRWLLLRRGQESTGWGLPLFFPFLHFLEDSTVGKPLGVLLGSYLGVEGVGPWEG